MNVNSYVEITISTWTRILHSRTDWEDVHDAMQFQGNLQSIKAIKAVFQTRNRKVLGQFVYLKPVA